MTPLLEIKSVPIEIEMKVSPAKLEYTRGTADLEVSRGDEGGLHIKSKPIRLNIDTYEASNSVVPTTARSIEQSAQKGKQAVYEATATYVQQGKLMLSAKIGEDVIGRLSEESLTKDVKTNVGLTFIPTTGPDITWDPGELNIRYEMDKLNFDWRITQPQFDFTPGDIEISVTQRPDVVITYVGGPIYVPRSADPNYEPIDVEA